MGAKMKHKKKKNCERRTMYKESSFTPFPKAQSLFKMFYKIQIHKSTMTLTVEHFRPLLLGWNTDFLFMFVKRYPHAFKILNLDTLNGKYLKQKRKDTPHVPSTAEQALVRPLVQDVEDQRHCLPAYPYTHHLRKDSAWKSTG